MECVVCFSIDAPVYTCSCKTVMCLPCLLKWLDTKNNMSCTSCKKDIVLSHIYQICSKDERDFLNEIIRKQGLVEDNLYFIQTQPFVELSIKNDKLEKDMKGLLVQINKIKDLPEKRVIEEYQKYFPNKKLSKTYILDKNTELLVKFQDLYKSQKQIIMTGLMPDNLKKTEVKIVRKCVKSDCTGFINHTNYECGVCNIKICKDCHLSISKTDNHVCKDEDIETIKSIWLNTKNCPNCFQRISKIDGCDQMFCVECDTAFSWNTGKIENGRIHNPHYYDKIRSGKLNVNNDHQNDPPNRTFFNIHFWEFFDLSKYIYVECIEMFKNMLNDIDVHYERNLRAYLHNRASRAFQNERVGFHKNYYNRYSYMRNIITKLEYENSILPVNIYSNLMNECQDHFQSYNQKIAILLNMSHSLMNKLTMLIDSIDIDDIVRCMIRKHTELKYFEKIVLSKKRDTEYKYQTFVNRFIELTDELYQTFQNMETLRHDCSEKIKNIIKTYDVPFTICQQNEILLHEKIVNTDITPLKRKQMYDSIEIGFRSYDFVKENSFFNL